MKGLFGSLLRRNRSILLVHFISNVFTNLAPLFKNISYFLFCAFFVFFFVVLSRSRVGNSFAWPSEEVLQRLFNGSL